MHETFINAIHSKNKLLVHFFSKEDRGTLVRTCAPMDYGPSRRARVKNNRYHFWDYDSDTRSHTLSLNPEQIQSIEVLEDKFDPAEFVTWATSWFVQRDWGKYS